MEYIFTPLFQKSSKVIYNNLYLIQICCFYHLWNRKMHLYFVRVWSERFAGTSLVHVSKYLDKGKVCTGDLESMCPKWQRLASGNLKIITISMINYEKKIDARWVLALACQLWLIGLKKIYETSKKLQIFHQQSKSVIILLTVWELKIQWQWYSSSC